MIRGALVADLAPDSLLGVQAGLVGREIVQPEIAMASEKSPHQGTFVPARAVDEEMNDLPPETCPETLEEPKEALGVPPRDSNHAVKTPKRCHPAKHIESFLVLTGSGDSNALPDPTPHSPKPGVLRESRLVFKDQDVPWAELTEFFLACGGTSRHPRPSPGGKHTLPVSAGTQNGAANSGLAEPSALRQSGAEDEPRRWARPKSLEGAHTPRETAPSPFGPAPGPATIIASAALVVASPKALPGLLDSDGAPNGSASFASTQTDAPETSADNPPRGEL